MYEVEQNLCLPVSVSNYFTTLAAPKVGCASDETISNFTQPII